MCTTLPIHSRRRRREKAKSSLARSAESVGGIGSSELASAAGSGQTSGLPDHRSEEYGPQHDEELSQGGRLRATTRSHGHEKLHGVGFAEARVRTQLEAGGQGEGARALPSQRRARTETDASRKTGPPQLDAVQSQKLRSATKDEVVEGES